MARKPAPAAAAAAAAPAFKAPEPVAQLWARIPWPHRGLWPNTLYKNGVALGRLRAAQRSDAKYAALHGLNGREFMPWFVGVTVLLTYTAYPPANRRYDVANMLAALKGAHDGLQDAIGIDDFYFRHGAVEFKPAVQQPCILILARAMYAGRAPM